MSKRIHPIRKMLDAMQREGAAMPYSEYDIERVVARHVKPLLEALERNHRIFVGHEYSAKLPPRHCVVCRLIAAWREAPK